MIIESNYPILIVQKYAEKFHDKISTDELIRFGRDIDSIIAWGVLNAPEIRSQMSAAGIKTEEQIKEFFESKKDPNGNSN